MFKIDTHIHSKYSPDCLSKIDDIIKKSKEKNLDIIAISDHDTVKGNKIARNIKNNNILVIPSIEISTKNGHLIGLGCTDLIKKDKSATETIDEIHDNAGLAIIPHPYCFYRHGLLCKEDYKKLKVDAIETLNARFIVGYSNNKAKRLSKRKKIPSLGASDAHYPEFIGDCYSVIECEKDIDSVLKAIKKGKTKACGKGTSNINLGIYLFNKNIRKKYY